MELEPLLQVGPPAMLPELPPELMAEILSRLPVKILLQMRCVSKRICKLIDSPSFIASHLRRSKQTRQNHFLILSHPSSDVLKSLDPEFLETGSDLYNPLDTPRSRSYRRKYPDISCIMSRSRNGNNVLESSQVVITHWDKWYQVKRQPQIWGSCNGLVLMSGWFEICLWNPSTRKHLVLPEIESCPIACRGFGYDGCKRFRYAKISFCCYGFGYLSADEDYKAVKICMCKDKMNEPIKCHQVWVYSLQSNSWTEVRKSFPPNIIKCHKQPGVLVCEVLYWPVKVRSETDLDEHGFILAFDLKTEEYQMFSQPSCENPEFYSRLGILNASSLCLIYSYMPIGFEIWVMEEHRVDDSWTRRTLRHEDFISYPGGFTRARLTSVKNDGFSRFFRPIVCDHLGLKIMTPRQFKIYKHTDVCMVSLVSLDGGADAATG